METGFEPNCFYDPENRQSYIYDPELTNKAAECMFG
jgi:hypothetical protein